MSTEEEVIQDDAPAAAALGLERYVQFAYVLFAAMAFFFLNKVIGLVWANFAAPPRAIIQGISGVLAAVGTLVLYRRPDLNEYSHAVAKELAKVVWPKRDETYRQTFTVAAVSVVASFVLGAFDFLWSYLTDLIY